MVTWPMTLRDLERSNLWPQYAYSAMSWKLLELNTSNLVCCFVSGMPSGRTNNFPWKWAWPKSRDPTIFGSTVGYPSESLASCFSWSACSSPCQNDPVHSINQSINESRIFSKVAYHLSNKLLLFITVYYVYAVSAIIVKRCRWKDVIVRTK